MKRWIVEILVVLMVAGIAVFTVVLLPNAIPVNDREVIAAER